MLATLSVNASPYSTSASNYKEQKNVILSDEAVAAYFKKKFETEDVKPAMVMEYLVRIMKKPKGGEDDKSEYLLNAVHAIRLNVAYKLVKLLMYMYNNIVVPSI